MVVASHLLLLGASHDHQAIELARSAEMIATLVAVIRPSHLLLVAVHCTVIADAREAGAGTTILMSLVLLTDIRTSAEGAVLIEAVLLGSGLPTPLKITGSNGPWTLLIEMEGCIRQDMPRMRTAETRGGRLSQAVEYVKAPEIEV